MMRFALLFLFALFASVQATAAQDGSPAPSAPNAERGTASDSAQQLLPVTIHAGEQVHRFHVEVARTPIQQARGLMYRMALPPDGGMLFIFPQPKIASFWMRNTYIALDIIFIRSDGTIDRIAANQQPHVLDPIVSRSPVVAVLEISGGTAARLNITENATIRWDDPS